MVLTLLAQPEPRTVRGRYKLPAKGFSVLVPTTAIGLLEGDPTVERGVRIRLSTGSSIFVYGDMNGSEWSTPADGVRWIMALEPECTSGAVQAALVGGLQGAGGRKSCKDEVVLYRLVFRPKGGPIYWLRLETDEQREAVDTKSLDDVAASFRLIPWQ